MTVASIATAAIHHTTVPFGRGGKMIRKLTQRFKEGFTLTLIELIIVVSIIGIIAPLALLVVF